MATIAAIDGCKIKRNAIGPLGRASRLFQMRSTFSMVTPRQTTPAIISKMPSVTTTFAKSPNCARMSVIPGTTQLTASIYWSRRKSAHCDFRSQANNGTHAVQQISSSLDHPRRRFDRQNELEQCSVFIVGRRCKFTAVTFNNHSTNG